MPNMSMERQVDITIRMLLALLTEPKMKANELAEVLNVNPNYVARMIGRFRESGLDIQYDFKKQRYTGKFTETLSKSILGPFANRLRKVVKEAEQSRQPSMSNNPLQRYDLEQWAQRFGTSASNAYNMITGYKGATLPSGWVAYQMTHRGKWYIQRMLTDRTGKVFSLPDNVKEAHEYRIGKGSIAKAKAPTGECAYTDFEEGKCHEPSLARGLCTKHYGRARRHPELFKKFLTD